MGSTWPSSDRNECSSKRASASSASITSGNAVTGSTPAACDRRHDPTIIGRRIDAGFAPLAAPWYARRSRRAHGTGSVPASTATHAFGMFSAFLLRRRLPARRVAEPSSRTVRSSRPQHVCAGDCGHRGSLSPGNAVSRRSWSLPTKTWINHPPRSNGPTRRDAQHHGATPTVRAIPANRLVHQLTPRESDGGSSRPGSGGGAHDVTR
jgi:hypothetical protein